MILDSCQFGQTWSKNAVGIRPFRVYMPEIRGFLSKTELRVCFVFLIDRNGLVQTGTKLSDQHLSARLRYGAHPYRPSIQTGRSARRSGGTLTAAETRHDVKSQLSGTD